MFQRFIPIFSAFPFLLYGLTAILNESPGTPAPWFTGPLLAPAATIVPAGSWNIEPYFYATKTPARYDNDWEPQSRPDLWVVSCQIPIWIGIAEWADIEIQPTLNWNHRQEGGGHWSLGDFTVQFEFQLNRDDLPHKNWIPSIKFAIREAIPIGKYRNFDPKKLSTDGGGGGSWATAFELVFGRMFHLSSYYYFSSRLSLIYTIPAPVHVKGFNAYGGGYGANGTAYPGQNFLADLAFEVSLSRNWAFSFDLLGVWQGGSRFSGNPGLSAAGFPASDMAASFIQYSVAPAIEYNFNESFGIIAGTWFTVAGKNVSEFYSAVIAFNYYK